MALLSVIVDVGDLSRTVAASFAAGLGVTLAFSLGIFGIARSVDASREGRALTSAGFAVLAIAGFLATAAAVATGLALMLAG